jgi:eukaryotic-like serine/threonine-protein kinase
VSDSGEVTASGMPGPEPVTRPRTAIGPGAVVGRHVVLHRLGKGGMGVVYAAYDPQLDRKIALKLLLPGAHGNVGRRRLLREAQALARLSHPNVVGIHDVGTVGEQVWLAMEFLQGQTLGKWLETRRAWPEVLEVLREAGEGLAAAHAAGLLHRDFKPDNVMVGDDGRVCVMDFGLAREHGSGEGRESASSQGSAESGSEPGSVWANDVTRVGVVVGTPGYMAPEQFTNHELTAAADQFAFCVTMWQALYGERPFGGDSPHEIAAQVLAGRLRAPARPRAVPGWLRHVCARGLAVAPSQRWPSMRALLEGLATGRARARARARARRGLAVVGALALLGAGIEAQQRWKLAQQTAACEATGREVDVAWNAVRERALRDALVATGVSYAATAADKVTPWLEQQAQAWREARVEACLAAEVHGRWDAAMLDRSLWCLEERRMRLESLVDELTLADADVLHRAVSAATGLASPAACRDEAVLEALVPPPPTAREALRLVRADVARASNLALAGRYAKGLAVAREALARATALGWAPLVAAARLQLGSLLDRTGAHAEAEAELERAYFDGVNGVAPTVAFDAASELVYVVGTNLARHTDGRRWARLAEVALADVPDGEHLRQTSLIVNLANLHYATGDYDEAERLHEQAVAIREQALGPDHPLVATSLNNLANVYAATGRFDEAKPLYLRVLALREAGLAPEHPYVANTLNNLANVHHSSGDYEAAKALHQRTLAMRERVLGPEHRDVAVSLANLATVYAEIGDYPRATALHGRSIAILEAALGPEHPEVATKLQALAEVHVAAGDHDEAARLCARALAIRETSMGPEHRSVAETLLVLADIALAQDRADEALSLAQRAVALHEKEGVAPGSLARARFALARALWDVPVAAGGDRVMALTLAAQAGDVFRATDEGQAKERAAVEAWLAAHRAE